MSKPTVATSPRLTREELKALIVNSWAVIVEDDRTGVLDVLLNMSAPVASLDEGTVQEQVFGLDLALGIRKEDGSDEGFYLFREQELLDAVIDKSGRSLEMHDGIRLCFTFPLQLREKQ